MIKLLNKGSGPDGLSEEFYKKFGVTLIQRLKKMFDSVMGSKTYHKPGGEATIVLISKLDQDVLDPSAYRPISLLNLDYKNFTSILVYQMNLVLRNYIHYEQAIFMKNRLVDDSIILLVNLIKMVHTAKFPTLLYFMGANKAFDRIEWFFGGEECDGVYGIWTKFLEVSGFDLQETISKNKMGKS